MNTGQSLGTQVALNVQLQRRGVMLDPKHPEPGTAPQQTAQDKCSIKKSFAHVASEQVSTSHCFNKENASDAWQQGKHTEPAFIVASYHPNTEL